MRIVHRLGLKDAAIHYVDVELRLAADAPLPSHRHPDGERDHRDAGVLKTFQQLDAGVPVARRIELLPDRATMRLDDVVERHAA